MNKSVDQQLHKLFVASIVVNGLIAVFDITAGFFFAYKSVIDQYFIALIKDAHTLDWLVSFLMSMSDRVQAIGAFYFFSHGAVKLFLVWGLWKKKLWAYPVSIIFLSVFSLYQLYQLFIYYSSILTVFLIFNTVVIIIIIKEYRRVLSITKSTSSI